MSLHPCRKDISKKRFHFTCFVGQNVENACQVPRYHRRLGHQNTMPVRTCSEVLLAQACVHADIFHLCISVFFQLLERVSYWWLYSSA